MTRIDGTSRLYRQKLNASAHDYEISTKSITKETKVKYRRTTLYITTG